MTARPLRAPRVAGLRVIEGKTARRPLFAPWVWFTLVVVTAFLGMAVARTALDHGAFELAELNRQIAVETTKNQQLVLDVARLESPARIGPLAEELGLVYPEERRPLLVEGVVQPDGAPDPRWAELANLAVGDRP